jgi:hypothetical protein
MKLLKFRGPRPWRHAFDILSNEELFCADYRTLNDPFEGLFSYSFKAQPDDLAYLHDAASIGDPLRVSQEIRNVARELPLICSLSRSSTDGWHDVRLWSYYGGGHQGIAIEIELAEDALGLHAVRYEDSLRDIALESNNGHARPVQILTTKTRHWEHEAEYRILHDEERYPIHGLITTVYCGVRCDERRVAEVRKIGEKKGFKVVKMALDREHVRVVPAA